MGAIAAFTADTDAPESTALEVVEPPARAIWLDASKLSMMIPAWAEAVIRDKDVVRTNVG
jgi:hypothetical protein